MNQLYSQEYRKKVLDMYDGGTSVEIIVQQTGISRSRIYTWIQEANLTRHRSNKNTLCLPSSTKPKNASLDLSKKKEMIDAFYASKNKTQFAQDHHIPRSTLYRWCRNSRSLIQAHNGKTINIKMYYELLRSNEKLHNIIEVLQSVHCTVFSPLQEKMAEMERLNDHVHLIQFCD